MTEKAYKILNTIFGIYVFGCFIYGSTKLFMFIFQMLTNLMI